MVGVAPPMTKLGWPEANFWQFQLGCMGKIMMNHEILGYRFFFFPGQAQVGAVATLAALRMRLLVQVFDKLEARVHGLVLENALRPVFDAPCARRNRAQRVL